MSQLPSRYRGGDASFPLERLRRDFDSLFGRFFGRLPMPFEQDLGDRRVWDFDVSENDNEVVVRAEMPGFEENEIDVQLHNDVLTIKAEKEEKQNGGRSFRGFSHTVTLPAGVNADKAQATYRNGVLELHIPRSEEVKPKRIQVQGNPAMSQQKTAAAPGSQAAGNKAEKAKSEKGK